MHKWLSAPPAPEDPPPRRTPRPHQARGRGTWATPEPGMTVRTGAGGGGPALLPLGPVHGRGPVLMADWLGQVSGGVH